MTWTYKSSITWTLVAKQSISFHCFSLSEQLFVPTVHTYITSLKLLKGVQETQIYLRIMSPDITWMKSIFVIIFVHEFRVMTTDGVDCWPVDCKSPRKWQDNEVCLEGDRNLFTIPVSEIEYATNVALPQYSLPQWG